MLRMSNPCCDLQALLDPGLDPIFLRPARLGVDSAWYGHLPFASWLTQALRPGLLVELGTHAGVSYAGFCEAVLRAGLPTRCVAVDGWTGDEHAGFYGEQVFAELLTFHDARYGAFSRLLRARFDAALPAFADGSIDLLHIDGRHRLEDVAGDYRSWLPKLSPQAVVLFHDTNVRAPDFGVWQFWAELRRQHPSFEFLHGHGLGVLAPGPAPPAVLAPLFELSRDLAATVRLRDRFALLGERWEADYGRVVDRREQRLLAGRADAAAALAAELATAQADGHGQRADAQRTRQALEQQRIWGDRLRDDLAHSKADRHRLMLEADRLRSDLLSEAARRTRASAALEEALKQLTVVQSASLQAAQRLQHERETAQRRLDVLQDEAAARQQALVAQHDEIAVLRRSSSWRLTRPLRAVAALLQKQRARELQAAATTSWPYSPPTPAPEPARPSEPVATAAASGPVSAPPEATTDAAAPGPAPPAWRRLRRILFIAGEPGTPGAVYRTERNAAACAAAGYEVEVVDIPDVNPGNLGAADLVVLWRAAWSGHIRIMLGMAREARTRVAFDVDDLIVKPSLAVAEIIDGIRTTFVTEVESRAYFQGIQRTLTSCDLCITTTDELAAPIGALHPIVHVLPNTFDAAAERASRYAVRLRAEQAGDGRVRLGYAGGTRTHQKDFATIAGALAQVLKQRPETLLVLFRDGASREGLVLIEEFPELVPLAGRIEWRDMVPLADLPAELARFDVSLCPLEQGNPFCEAKSELKYFESALAGVCLVASPTGPFRRAVRDGVTGFLPQDAAGWEQVLLMLVDQPQRRREVARAAYHDVLWQFGPRRQTELWAQLLAGLDGGPAGARAAELALRRGAYRSAELPVIPGSELLFAFDALGEARVTVGMTSYNYESYLGEALDSVSAQTLEALDLVVVDDGSADGSVALLLDWAERNRMRFNRLRILRTARNAGLGGARNLVFDQAETPWIMVLDSDNRLQPAACVRLLEALDAEPLAAFAYPLIRQFGARDELMGEASFDPFQLASGNYIDAMAMIAKWAWAAAGGYYVRRDAMGWEDFTLWCRLVELGQFGLAVPEELAGYRVHPGSMVNAITEQAANKTLMVEFVETRHPWLRLRMRDTRQRR